MKIAVFDIDGVLADFEGLIVDIFGEGRGREFYCLGDRYDTKVMEKVNAIVNDANYYYPLNPIKQGFGFLAQASPKYQIMIMTSRPHTDTMERFTKKWLARQLRDTVGLQYEDLLGVKFTLNKSADLFLIRDDVAFFVDDNPEEIEEAKRIGIPSYSWAQPWNEHVFPKLFPERDGTVWYQELDYTEPVRFWQKDE